jgi:ABC-type Co2+ transport system permease subunit
MHIEPELVSPEKMLLAYATAAAAGAMTVKFAVDTIRERGVVSLLARAAIATAAVFVFFEIFPHYPVGVSEVHLILGSTLLLLFGAAPAAIGLALGLLIQGLFFAPFDLPQYFANVTTLVAPLVAIKFLADRIIMLVVLLEPLVDLAVLAGAKLARGLGKTGLVTPRLYA